MGRRAFLGLTVAALFGTCLSLALPVRVPAGAEFALSSDWDLLGRADGVRSLAVYREAGSPLHVDIALSGASTAGPDMSEAGVAIDRGEGSLPFTVVADTPWRLTFDNRPRRSHACTLVEFLRPVSIRLYVRRPMPTQIVPAQIVPAQIVIVAEGRTGAPRAIGARRI